ncbi:MAG: hypothetical protein JWN34_460 [Bryobacterales bacterium]|nr:hypothetical protein [Bryobacterales bacterium]
MAVMLRTVALYAILLSSPFSAHVIAQSTSASTLSGTVTDPNDRAMSGVHITATNPETQFSRETFTGPDGVYQLDLLPPSVYELRAAQPGFTTLVRRGLALTVGASATVDLKMQIAAASSTVEVTAEVPSVETERTHQANTIEQRAIADLPIDRRDYLSFSLLAPGVSDSKAHADSNSYRVKQTPDSGLSFYGSNGRGNNVNVDGGESNDGGGGVRATVGQEAVLEFQVNRSNYSAQYGGSRGGVVNIVTKGGTNNLHGTAFGFFRHQALDATNPFNLVVDSANHLTRVKPESERQQFGTTIGGPIAEDKTFFFLDYEQLRRRESSAVSILTDLSVFGPTAAQRAILAQLPAAASAQLTAALSTPIAVQQMFQINSGIFPFQSDQHQGLLRLDHRLSQGDQISARFNTTRSYETNPNVSALTGISRGFVTDVFDTVGSFNWVHVFNPRLINEAHVQFDYYDLLTGTNEKFGPALEISGFGNFNRDRFLPSDSIHRRTEFFDNLTWGHGRHTFRIGAYTLLHNEHSDSATFMSGRFTFGALPGSLVNPALASTTINSLQAFNLGLAQSYQQGFGSGVVGATLPLYAGYVQDAWRVSRSLTVSAGLRYELDNRRVPLPTDHNKLAPRLGFAWSPDSKTVLRGGYGIYYATIDFQIDYSVYALGVTPSGFRPIAQVLTTIQTPGPQSAANIFSTLRARGVLGIPSPTRSITAADLTQFGINISQTGPLPPLSVVFSAAPDYRSPQTQQASLGLQRDFGKGFNGGINGIFVRGSHLTNAYDNNLLASAPFDKTLGTQNYLADASHPGGYFVNPLIFQSNVYGSNSNSFYGGLILEGGQRLGRSVQLNANYTWSHATDETTDYNSDFEPNNQFCRRCDRASSSFDERHKLVAYAILKSSPERHTVLRNWVFSPIYQYHSGRPFNLLVGGADLNNDRHNTTDRPPYVGRNTGLGPAFWTFDTRLQRTILLNEKLRLNLMFEAFNLFNRLSYQSVNNTVGATFAPTSAVTGRPDRTPTDSLGFTSAFDPRRIQLGFRLAF